LTNAAFARVAIGPIIPQPTECPSSDVTAENILRLAVKMISDAPRKSSSQIGRTEQGIPA
jgi:hypothetical protein